MKAIIPAAGYGTRMGMAPHEAKELLPDATGAPLIDYSLNLCKEYGLDPCVIVRTDKKELCSYLHQKQIEMFIVENDTYHMSDSVLRAKEAWSTHNVLLLPDCRFAPTNIIKDVQESLTLHEIVCGIFPVNDPEKWGIIRERRMWEHPSGLTPPQLAWGIIGWRFAAGSKLWFYYAQGCKNGQTSSLRLDDAFFLPLDHFEDLTHV